jgi:hypothetical protein
MTDLYLVAAGLSMLAIGLWVHWKPAAIAVVTMSGAVGLYFGVGSLYIPFPDCLFILFLALLLALPAFVMIKQWSRLKSVR